MRAWGGARAIARFCSRSAVDCSRSAIATRSSLCRPASTLARARAAWGDRLVIHPEVEDALESKSKGVVCLETAIVTHGMPYPHNLNTAQSVESIIRAQGAVPATIAILDSRVHIGLTPGELEYLADPSTSSRKVSRRDVARLLTPKLAAGGARGQEGHNGGTTVAGTMLLARSVGIDLFVTGGIGGVHRGAATSMDVSADLHELANTPMGVVCAGAKSILDIGLTLEVLESLGVDVVTLGETADFPAFYSPTSGFMSNDHVRTPQDAARLLHTSLTLPRPLSTLFAVPIPVAHHAAGEDIQRAVERAVRESEEQGVSKRGKEVTPWLLKRVGELTAGRALESNIALVENNAVHGAQIAVELNRLQREERPASSATTALPVQPSTGQATSERNSSAGTSSSSPLPRPTVLVVGSAAIDVTAQAAPATSNQSILHTTAPGRVQLSPGGVARNIAEAATRLLPAGQVQLLSAIGGRDGETDAFGTLLCGEMEAAGMRTDGLIRVSGDGAGTAVCNLILGDQGGLIAGVADMDVIERLEPRMLLSKLDESQPQLVVLDTNAKVESLTAILKACRQSGVPTLIDPTSMTKTGRLTHGFRKFPIEPRPSPRLITHLSPNVYELDTLHQWLQQDDVSQSPEYFAVLDQLGIGERWRTSLGRFAPPGGFAWATDVGLPQKMTALLPWTDNVWLKCGSRGVLHLGVFGQEPPAGSADEDVYRLVHQIDALPSSYLCLTYFPAQILKNGDMVSSTGAGDSFVGALAAGIVGSTRSDHQPSVQAVKTALQCASLSLQSLSAVSEAIAELRSKQ